MDINNRSNQNLLNRLEKISSAASECNLNFLKLTNVEDDIKEISLYLNITAEQAIFFACLAEMSLQRTVTLAGLSRHLKCSVLKLITFMNELEALEKKGYIQKTFRTRGRKLSYNDVGFSVPHHVIEAIRKADISLLSTATKFDLPGFLKQISDIVDERHENALTTAQVISETDFLISNNIDLPFVSYIDKTLALTISKCAAFAISYCRLKGQFCISIDGFADAVFDELNEMLEFEQQVSSSNHELIRKNILKLTTSEFDGEKSVSLTQNISKILFQSYPDLLIADCENSGLILHKTLTEKKLFFNNEIRNQVKELEKVLNPSKFKVYSRELHRNGLTRGITSIFYGAPGTGKTEAVYQIARKTGRDIMMVDLSQTKSKWFGESEKIVKKIFEDYSLLVKNSDIEPILFVNEADGLFKRRIDLGNRGTTSDQTMNTIQNILLQALEHFEGILIATTNLTGNLDRAFERRFTFKIDFPRPDEHSRQKIWKSKIPELTQGEASALSERFEITGGEIDVQVRQIILQKVLYKKINLFDALVDNCSRDHGFTTKRRVGF
jgi:hypothetical protein